MKISKNRINYVKRVLKKNGVKKEAFNFSRVYNFDDEYDRKGIKSPFSNFSNEEIHLAILRMR